jgi:hypothetical protein
MEDLYSGKGRNNENLASKQEALREKKFRYILVKIPPWQPGLNYYQMRHRINIKGTDDAAELVNPTLLGEGYEITDTQNGKTVSRVELAEKYVASLTPAAKAELFDKVLVRALLSTVL